MARVLLAEPDPDVLELVERALSGWGHEVVRYRPASAPGELDLMVFEPGMGARVVRLAETLAAGTPPVQLVVVSVNPPELAVHALRPAAYVLKPFSLAELEAAVAAALRRVEEGR